MVISFDDESQQQYQYQYRSIAVEGGGRSALSKCIEIIQEKKGQQDKPNVLPIESIHHHNHNHNNPLESLPFE